MILVVTEKNNAAQKISELMADTKPKTDKVYNTQVYRFTHDGEEWVTIGLRGHILGLDFVSRLEYSKKEGWVGIDADDNKIPATDIPDKLEKPPFKKRRPFYENGVILKDWKVPVLPYLVYAPVVKTPAEKDIIRSLKNLAKKASEIIIATDFDREGELIGADALLMINEVTTDVPIFRARYSALTKGEITRAFDNLVELDHNLAEAGDSRRVIDLVWGAVLTRYLTMAKFGGFGTVRSAGRVQTPTLAIIVERERERLAFVPTDYWVIKGKCTDSNSETFQVTHKVGRFEDEAAAKAAFSKVESADKATVSSVDRKMRKVLPPAPFNTTSLQTTASSIGLTPGRVMRIAESLYMGGYISYPRVDNTVYPSSINLADNLRMLAGNPAYAPYANKLLSKGKLTATRGKTQTTDHPPIHPTGLASKEKLSAEEWKLYNLIARRFMATLSDPAQIEATKVSLDVNGEEFVAHGDSVVDPGFREIYPYGSKKEDELPIITSGDVLEFSDPSLEKKQTEPPARYTQGRLVQEMERLGLGTKSTRASIIDRLQEVKYIQGNPIEPTQLGMAVIDALGQFAPRIVSPNMTSELEEEMSEIAEGQKSLDGVVGHSRDLLDDVIEVLIPKKEEVGDALADAVQADAKVGVCPKCGHDLLLKNSAKTKSRFIGCSAWPECDVTYPVPDGRLRPVEEVCPICGSPQIQVQAFRSKPQIICIDPNCKSNYEPSVDVGECKKCAEMGKVSHLIAQKNPKTLKRFIRCQNYDECHVSYPLPRQGKIEATGEYCEHCGAPLVVIVTNRGPWKICPNLDCPGREKDEKKTNGRSGSKRGSRKSTSRRASSRASSSKS
ncbi:MAG: DNA topoisomerase I [Coriobacteriales bacterium]